MKMTSPYVREASKRAENSQAPIPLTTPKQKFARLILRKRFDRGLRQKDVALLAGVNESTMSMVEAGEYSPCFKTLGGLITALNISSDELHEVFQ